MAAFCLTGIPAWPQVTSTGAVGGRITDPQALAVPDAAVRLTDVSTALWQDTVTNNSGRYIFPGLPPGVYRIAVSKTGFARAQVAAQHVEVGSALTVDVVLEVNPLETVMEVQAGAGAELQTLNATLGTTIRFDSLLELPNLGRDASTLVELQPAVSPVGAVAGAVRDQNGFLLDGANNNSDIDGTMNLYTISYASNGGPTGVMPTPVESIEEFKVATVGLTADMNGSAGGQVSMVTRRGTDQWHGALYEFYLGTNVGAANYWKNNHVPSPTAGLPYTPLPRSHYNRFGVAGGGPLLPKLLGGKTYVFANYEGYRYPLFTTYERASPTPLMRLGVIQAQNASGHYQAYNLNPYPVTHNGVTYTPSPCPSGQLCDPRGIGINPTMAQLWNKFMPQPNDPGFGAGDGVNTQGYLAAIATPQSSNMLVARVDHDFGPRWRLFSVYRYFAYTQLTTSQVDIGGALPGDRLGVPAAQAPHPQKPDSITVGLTTTYHNLTNDLRANYLRNWWQYSSAGAPPQLPGLAGALEPGGESPTGSLVPYNVNAGSARQRVWDGQDRYFRDDASFLRRDHLFQFGGQYQRNFDYLTRDDNGTALTTPVYQMTGALGSVPSAYIPSTVPPSQYPAWTTLYAETLGIVSRAQLLYTRGGTNLHLLQQGTPVFDQVIVPGYNFYFSDAWQVRPSFTLTYGLNYAVEIPPYEENGKQVMLLDSGGAPIQADQYLAQRLQAAQAGQVYDPSIGFAAVRNVSGGRKYPYDPFYGGISPRLSAAWNPRAGSGPLRSILGDHATVIRAGYSRVYGRMNGVNLVLGPLLGPGLLQAVSCQGMCPGPVATDPVNGFRIGVDGNAVPLPAAAPTLPQPYLPGQIQNGVSNPPSDDVTLLDPATKPSRSDQFNVTIQRALSPKLMFEAGYIGQVIRHQFELVDLDSVDTRLTLNGQSLESAWANLYNAVSAGAAIPAQPFFDAALGGSNSAYCSGFPNCAAAVAGKLKSGVAAGQVYTVFQSLESQPSWTLGRTFINSPIRSQATSVLLNLSDGWGNYNAGFLSFSFRDFHGLTARSNFTWSKALGSATLAQSFSGFTVVDPFNLRNSYGPEGYDTKFVYNLTMVYRLPWFGSQRGFAGEVLGGWSIAPLFTAQTGYPLAVLVGSGCQTFGEGNCGSVTAFENAAAAAPYTGGASVKYGVTPASGPGAGGNPALVAGASGMNMFSNPGAIYSEFRRPVLGQDFNDSGMGIIRGFPTWNLDLAVHKQIAVTERFDAMLMIQATNVLNHFQPANPTLSIDSPQTWGVITGQANNPRSMEFGLRLHF
jgi:hypothetical protein